MSERSADDYWSEDAPDEAAPAAGPVSPGVGAPPPSQSPERSAPVTLCWNCSVETEPEDAVCPSCSAERLHAVLTCEQNALRLLVGAGQCLRIGRDPRWAPGAAALLRDFNTVSRKHAVVTVERQGEMWVEEAVPTGSTNRTRVDDVLVPPGGRLRMRDGSRLSLGLSVHFSIRLHGLPGSDQP